MCLLCFDGPKTGKNGLNVNRKGSKEQRHLQGYPGVCFPFLFSYLFTPLLPVPRSLPLLLSSRFLSLHRFSSGKSDGRMVLMAHMA